MTILFLMVGSSDRLNDNSIPPDGWEQLGARDSPFEEQGQELQDVSRITGAYSSRKSSAVQAAVAMVPSMSEVHPSVSHNSES